jgi:transcriptional regulator with XRE-family HTH domain
MDKSTILRGLRALASLDQSQAAAMAGLSLRTIKGAESIEPSDKTWRKLRAMYEAEGASLVTMPTLSGAYVAMIQLDCPPDIFDNANAKD